MKKNIVISFGINSKNFSIWSNGSIQNIFFLFLLLEKIENYNVYIVNFGKPISEISCDEVFKLNEINFTDWEDIKNDVDVFIEAGITVDNSIIKELKDKGTKIIQFRTGNAYIIDSEDILFNDNCKSLNINKYDQIWILPHHSKINKQYLEEIYKSPTYIMPFIWDSFIIDMYNEYLKLNGFYSDYQNIKKPKNILIMEPNLNIIKSCLIPILISEKTYNKDNNLINKVILFNTNKIKNNNKFLSIIKSLNIYKNNILQLEDRYNTPFILSKYGDIILSHQWENELNYLYLDVLYNKYPLVHNSIYFKDTGYYYGNFNIESGSNMLIESINGNNYNKQLFINNNIIKRFSIINELNINEFISKINMLFQ